MDERMVLQAVQDTQVLACLLAQPVRMHSSICTGCASIRAYASSGLAAPCPFPMRFTLSVSQLSVMLVRKRWPVRCMQAPTGSLECAVGQIKALGVLMARCPNLEPVARSRRFEALRMLMTDSEALGMLMAEYAHRAAFVHEAPQQVLVETEGPLHVSGHGRALAGCRGLVFAECVDKARHQAVQLEM
jgi:hypothetical protein